MTPIKRKPSMILDVGTGSGNSLKHALTMQGQWAVEVAEQFPTARVIGMDLAPIQPTSDIPVNCEFIIGDLTEDLVSFGGGSFDLVHSR